MMTKDQFKESFRRNANSMAVRWGVPVWLVGGAIADQEPRDWDVRIVLPTPLFRFIYGGVDGESRHVDYQHDWEPWEWRRAYDNIKLSRQMSHRMQANIDLQIQSQREANRYRDEHRERLDGAPDWVLAAAFGKIGAGNVWEPSKMEDLAAVKVTESTKMVDPCPVVQSSKNDRSI